ncbi:MAG: cupin domain-containing protein [Bacteriovoracaceae bacterium]|nr:cupin domain-containing protein [Bacteriovoracaceae bacterium]
MKITRGVGLQFQELISKETGEKYSFSTILERDRDFFIHLERLPSTRRISAPHAHSDTDECIYVLEGTVFAINGQEIVQIRKGDFVRFDKGSHQLHTIENRSTEEAVLLVVTKTQSTKPVFAQK